MIPRKLVLAAVVMAVVLATGNARFAAAEQEFSDTQKQEMHEIIRDYLISNPSVLREAFEALERQQQVAQEEDARKSIKEHASALFQSEHGFVYGNPDGDVTMVEFFDYNCGYCKRSLGNVVDLVNSDSDLKLVLKEFPILGPGSIYAARAAIAAKQQDKYWELHQALMKHKGAVDESLTLKIAEDVGLDIEKLKADMDDPVVAKTINESMELANAIGINGTPAFVIDDTLIPGALDINGLRQHIADVRDNGGCQVC